MLETSDTKVANTEDWRRNPWVWLIIAIPSLTVLGCMLTMYLAISNPHIIVGGPATQSSTTDGSKDSGSN